MNVVGRKRGLLIVFEGVDRVGKSTQVQMLKDWFASQRHEITDCMRFPGTYILKIDRTTQSGKLINDLLTSKNNMSVNASHLLFSFNRWEKKDTLISLLERGVNVIVDRYAFSGVVYSVCNVILLFYSGC